MVISGRKPSFSNSPFSFATVARMVGKYVLVGQPMRIVSWAPTFAGSMESAPKAASHEASRAMDFVVMDSSWGDRAPPADCASPGILARAIDLAVGSRIARKSPGPGKES